MRKSAWLCGTILGGLISSPQTALASCTPEPSVANSQATCDGNDPDGFTITETGVSVIALNGASVGARLDGAGAIVLQRPSGQAFASLDNSGTVASTQGRAVTVIDNIPFQGFGTITNRENGIIAGSFGAIYAVVTRLENSGLIDGGNDSAYSFAASGGTILFPSAIFNSGVIRSNSISATIDLPFGSPQQFLNSGQIVNFGTGLAYRTNESIALVNDSTGVIGTSGPIALQSDFGLLIRNSGIINGSVLGGSGNDLVDTRSGLINGDVALGGNADRLIAVMGADRLVAGISGAVNGGDGIDILELIVNVDRTLSNATLPTGFENLQLNLENGAALTVTATQVPTGGFAVRGSGSLTTAVNINHAGPIITGQITQQNLGFENLHFFNTHTLQAQLSLPYEAVVSLENLDSVVNTGLIRGTGGSGAYFGLNTDGLVTNDGTIEADQTGLSLNGSLINNGVIRSSSDIALNNYLGGGTARGKTSINNGLIEGNQVGANISSMTFVNNGTIIATNGIGVRPDFFSTIDNRQDGVISGSVAGISYATNAIVINSGIINGGIDFTVGDQSSSDIFIDRGGMANGGIRLGGGDDIFIADLDRGFGGVSGIVDAGEGVDTVRWRVSAATTTSIIPIPTFERVGYDLENDASLVISGDGQSLQGIDFSGDGDIDISLDITNSNGPLLDLTASPADRLIDVMAPISGNLDIISRGTLTYNLSPNDLQGVLAGVYASTFIDDYFDADTREVRFENAGTLKVQGLGEGLITPFGIMGGTEVRNSGLIELSSAIGVGRADTLINTGTIRQAPSGTRSLGVFDVPTVVNSGTIDTQGAAVTYDGWFVFPGTQVTVENSGIINSQSDAAIRLSARSWPALIHNANEGTISGLEDAIIVSGGAKIRNEGVINGNIDVSIDESWSGNQLLNAGTINGNIYLGGSATFISEGALNGNLTFGSGDDIFIQRGATTGVTGTIDAGDGRDAFGRSYATSQTIELGAPLPATFEEEFFEASNANTMLTLTGSSAPGSRVLIGGAGQFVNKGAIGGQIIGSSYDDLVPSLVNDGTISEGLLGDIGKLVNNGTIHGFVQITGSDTTEIDNNGTIDGIIYLGDTNDIVDTHNGTMTGSVYLNEGEDRLIIGDRNLGGTHYLGGDGIDTLEYAGSGTSASPGAIGLNFHGFERLEVSSGVLGDLGVQDFVQITITGGRIIGVAGSILSSPQFLVGPGGTFGSAGTVNGSIVVAGTLSPGASPGTMTINGDVSLTTGSTTLFEMTPTISDAVVIDGALAIATGATLKLTGERPLTPGTSYDLITASEGITGSFSIIDKEAGVVGLVRQGEDSIQLLGQFALDPDATSNLQASRAADYLNALLIDTTAADRIIDAVPLLTDATGFADTAKLRLLTPEAYASASQIGVENGLALASAARTTNLTDRSEAGPFTFGQWFGNWRTMPGRTGVGTAKADISTRGLIGGVGFGSEAASVGAFVGYIDATQRIGALGAKTESNGVVAGMIGQMKLGGAEFSILTAFDGSKADTRRALPDASTATSRYKMHGWTTDASLGYAFAIGGGWNLRPSVGVTHIRSTRDGAVEAGGSPLALEIDGRRTKATFLNADLMIKGSPEDRIQPWLSAGLRHQTGGNAVTAAAALTGLSSSFSVPGAPRDRTQATVSAGLGAAISPMATLFFGVSSEFGANSNGQSANGGLKMRF